MPLIDHPELIELTCQELVELVTEYLEQALPPPASERFAQHLAKCEGCRNYVNQIKRTIVVLGQTVNLPLSEDEQTRLRTLFRHRQSLS
jgi:predicted anti-sigma-YlaC factor YlaD